MSFTPFDPEIVAMDTGEATAVTARSSVFTPPGTGATITAPLLAVDYGQATQVTSRPNTFDPWSGTSTTVNPGY